jgi:hypothetical protein
VKETWYALAFKAFLLEIGRSVKDLTEDNIQPVIDQFHKEQEPIDKFAENSPYSDWIPAASDQSLNQYSKPNKYTLF